MAVDVRRNGVRRVTQVFLDNLGVRAGGEQEACCGVPQPVQVDAAQTGALRENLEPPQDVAGLERRAGLGGEGQAVLLADPCGLGCSSSCRILWARSASTADRGSGTVRRDLSVLGSSSCSPLGVRARVRRTRKRPASRSTSGQCSASASPRRSPVASMTRNRVSNRSPLIASSSHFARSAVRCWASCPRRRGASPPQRDCCGAARPVRRRPRPLEGPCRSSEPWTPAGRHPA